MNPPTTNFKIVGCREATLVRGAKVLGSSTCKFKLHNQEYEGGNWLHTEVWMVDPVEAAAAIRHIGPVARNPGWIMDWFRGGRPALFKRLVGESLVELRSHSVPVGLAEVAKLDPVSVLGRLGAPQELLYYLTRLVKPKLVLETGVFRGLSSAFILGGLMDNNSGHLHSIDLPSASYSVSASGNVYASSLGKNEMPGFAVPESLKERWTLHLGDSRKLMPELLAKMPQLDMFYHDSEHTYEMMTWEFETVLPHMPGGALFTSDDVRWNDAFNEFIHRHRVGWSAIARDRLGIALTPERPQGIE